MKFSWKVFFCTVIVVALAFGTGGYFLISSMFSASLAREQSLAFEENRILRFTFITTLATQPDGIGGATDELLKQIAESMDVEQPRSKMKISVRNDKKQLLYTSENRELDPTLIEKAGTDRCAYQVWRQDGQYFAQTASVILGPDDRVVYLGSYHDITSVFQERDAHFRLFGNTVLVTMLLCSILMFFLSRWLTRPLRTLSRAARRIADGKYSERAAVTSGDEAGDLARDFNTMADALERKITELEDEANRRESFIASFAHELKTPMTSIIGYADMLRSIQLEPEKHFLAANYIFSEGKRLESLSLKLLDILVLQKTDFALKPLSAAQLAKETAGLYFPVLQESGLRIEICCEDRPVQAEPDLFKTLLINLLDNARKASDPGSCIRISGTQSENDYLLTVQDYGRGIPEEELPRITEAFYMVDKSRARAQNGAGLGLAICAQIAEIHGARLSIESKLGNGTAVTIRLKGGPS